MILLPQAPECWEYRHVPPFPVVTQELCGICSPMWCSGRMDSISQCDVIRVHLNMSHYLEADSTFMWFCRGTRSLPVVCARQNLRNATYHW
jgi:hypothetical protein